MEAQRTPGRTTFSIQGAVFSFLTKTGVVVKLHPRQREDALKVRDSKPYSPKKDEEAYDELVELPLETSRDLNQALPWLRRACRSAQGEREQASKAPRGRARPRWPFGVMGTVQAASFFVEAIRVAKRCRTNHR